jgi:glycosyltransferase involved in cell wall biosynthesis
VTPLVFVSGEYPPDIGGVGDYTAQLRAALGWPSQVIARRDVGRWNARGVLRALSSLPGRRGIVHIQYQAAAFDLLGDICLLPLLVRATRPHVRLVTTFHDARVPFLFRGARLLRLRSVRLLARTSHAIIAADERDLTALGSSAGQGHQVPIGSNVPCSPPNGYARQAFRHALGVADDETLVAYFGLLNASKGLDTLLDVLDRLERARLLFIGGNAGASDATNRATTERLAQRLSNERITVTGFLEAREVSAHLLAADVAVLPYSDGASARRGSLLACAAHGLPIVSTEPASQAVADAVLAVPSGNAAALADAVQRVMADAALAERLRQGSAALAERTSWRHIALAHRAIYERLLYSPNRGYERVTRPADTDSTAHARGEP